VTAVFFAMFGVSYLVSQYIQFVQGPIPSGWAFRFLPSAMGSLVGANVAARLTARFRTPDDHARRMLLVTGGLVTLATLSVVSGFVPVALRSALVGSGMGLVTVPASNAIVGTLPADRVGAGSGLRAMVQLLGGTMGVAIVGSLASGVYRSDIQTALQGPLRHVRRLLDRH